MLAAHLEVDAASIFAAEGSLADLVGTSFWEAERGILDVAVAAADALAAMDMRRVRRVLGRPGEVGGLLGTGTMSRRRCKVLKRRLWWKRTD